MNVILRGIKISNNRAHHAFSAAARKGLVNEKDSRFLMLFQGMLLRWLDCGASDRNLLARIVIK